MQLEDRAVPAGLGGSFGHLSSPGPATHLQVIVPENVQAGQTFNVTVEALDASNRVASGYTGAIDLSSSDATATGSATRGGTQTLLTSTQPFYTFTASDHGVHVFQAVLTATGNDTITAHDAANASLADTETTDVTPAPVATKVIVSTPETAATGVPTRVTVQVLDQSGHVLRNFTGQVTLTSADTTATGSTTRHGTATSLPIQYTFTASDHGEHTFEVTFNASITGATSTSVTATTTAAGTVPSLTGTAQLTLYPPTTVTHFGVQISPLAVSGTAVPLEVVALNASNQIVSGYTGTVTLASSDPTAQASTTRGGTATSLSGTPSFTYTFSSSDAGKHTFYVTFGTTGSQTVTVTDSANSLADTETVQVLTSSPFPRHRGWTI